MAIPVWDRYPHLAEYETARSWLTTQVHLGLADNTIEAYARGLGDYLGFSKQCGIEPEKASREHITLFVHDMATRENRQSDQVGLSNATMQQRLTIIRLFYDQLMEDGIRGDNPVGRGRYTPGKAFGGARERGLIPRYRKQPWIPTSEEWHEVLKAAQQEPLRNRVMLALSYDGALRREELCSLQTGDIDPALRLIRIRAETTKNRQGRVVPYSVVAGDLYVAYLDHRRQISRARGPLFLSESRRNYAEPLSIWTWSKVVKGIALRSGVYEFTTHTPRHLCLTDLARAGWDIHEIARFAGHRSIQTTLLYIRLSAHDLAQQLERSMLSIHGAHLKMVQEILGNEQDL